MWGQPSVRSRIFENAGSGPGARQRRGLSPPHVGFILLLGALAGLTCIVMPGAARAQDSVLTIDNEFLTDTRLTSGLLVGGPPEVGREMAIVGGAMFDAANAANGMTYAPVAYSGGAVSGVSVDAAALATDGAATAILNGINHPYTPPNTNPGTYVPTSNRPAMFPEWNIVAPSGLSSATMNALIATVPPPPPVTSAAYAQNVLQTECQGGGSVLPANIDRKSTRL